MGMETVVLLLPVERVEVVVLEPHDQHGVVLLTDSAGVAGQLHTAPGHAVHHNGRVWANIRSDYFYFYMSYHHSHSRWLL